MYGYNVARAICAANQRAPHPALRLAAAGAEEELLEAGIQIAPGALLTGARRLLSGDLAHSLAFRDHHVAVQDEASQLVAALVGKGERILDCCAAPGGKTAAMAQRNPAAAITAVELYEHRARALRERVQAMRVQVVTGNVTGMEFAGKASIACWPTCRAAARERWRRIRRSNGGCGWKIWEDLKIYRCRSYGRPSVRWPRAEGWCTRPVPWNPKSAKVLWSRFYAGKTALPSCRARACWRG